MSLATPREKLYWKTIAIGLVPLVLVAVLSGCGGPKRHMPTWSRVLTVPPQTKTEVRLYKDEAPPGSHKIEGRFHSATDDSVTLTLPDSQSRTFQKQSVREFLIHRPISKRWPGWLTWGVALISIPLLMPERGELVGRKLLFGGLIGFPFAVAAFHGSRMGGIYDVPPEYRTPPPPPAKQPNAGKKPPGKNSQ